VELRRPYQYTHSVLDGKWVGVVSLRNLRVDSRPEISRLLQRNGNGGENGVEGGQEIGVSRRGFSLCIERIIRSSKRGVRGRR